MKTRERMRNHFSIILTEAFGKEPKAEVLDKLMDIAKPERKLTDQQAMIGALSEVMEMQSSLNGSRLAAFAANLLRNGGTSEEVRAYYGKMLNGQVWQWYKHDWRGKKGDKPNERGIRETWGKWAVVGRADLTEKKVYR